MAEAKIKLMIPSARAVYPHILQEDKYQFTENGKREFNTKLLLTPDDDEAHAAFISKVTELVESTFAEGMLELEAKVKDPAVKGKAKAAAKEAVENLKRSYPWDPEFDDEGEETGNFIVKTKCVAGGVVKNGPKKGQDWAKVVPLYDAAGQAIIGNARKSLTLWGGSELITEVEAFPFCAEGLEKAGISLRLLAVQVITAVGGEGGGSAESHGFGVVEGGYKADTFANATGDNDAPEVADTSADDDF
jgi:hypothetical protein